MNNKYQNNTLRIICIIIIIKIFSIKIFFASKIKLLIFFILFLFAFTVGATEIFPSNILYFVTKCRKNDKLFCLTRPRFPTAVWRHDFCLYFYSLFIKIRWCSTADVELRWRTSSLASFFSCVYF